MCKWNCRNLLPNLKSYFSTIGLCSESPFYQYLCSLSSSSVFQLYVKKLSHSKILFFHDLQENNRTQGMLPVRKLFCFQDKWVKLHLCPLLIFWCVHLISHYFYCQRNTNPPIFSSYALQSWLRTSLISVVTSVLAVFFLMNVQRDWHL